MALTRLTVEIDEDLKRRIEIQVANNKDKYKNLREFVECVSEKELRES